MTKRTETIINYPESNKEIVLELKGDLYHMKYHNVYETEDVLKLNDLLFAAEENMKYYYQKEHALELLKQYEDILKEVIILSTDQRDKKQLEKYALIVGTYTLISHVESPLYYLEKIDLNDYLYEDIVNIAEVIIKLPTVYLSLMCPILVLPEVHQRLMCNAKYLEHTPVEEMMNFCGTLIAHVNQYKKVDRKEQDKKILRYHEEVQSLLNITSERGFSFLCSNTQSELAWNNIDDKPNAMSLIHQVLKTYEQKENKNKELIKK